MLKKRGDEGGGGDSWMNTYADMVTLLLTFFAVMLSMSSVDEAKFNAFIKSFSNLPQEVVEEIIGNQTEPGEEEGEPYISGLNELYISLKKYVEDNNQTSVVEVSASKDGEIVYISFDSLMFFYPDEYKLLDSSLPTMSFIGDGLKKHEKKIRTISVCGHTADLSGGYGTSNVSAWFLSVNRAAEVVQYFDDEKGLDPEKMIPIGYGGERPIASNKTEEGRQKNRRVELIVVGVDSKEDFNVADPLGTRTTDNPTISIDEETVSKAQKKSAASNTEASKTDKASESGTASGAESETKSAAASGTESKGKAE